MSTQQFFCKLTNKNANSISKLDRMERAVSEPVQTVLQHWQPKYLFYTVTSNARSSAISDSQKSSIKSHCETHRKSIWIQLSLAWTSNWMGLVNVHQNAEWSSRLSLSHHFIFLQFECCAAVTTLAVTLHSCRVGPILKLTNCLANISYVQSKLRLPYNRFIKIDSAVSTNIFNILRTQLSDRLVWNKTYHDIDIVINNIGIRQDADEFCNNLYKFNTSCQTYVLELVAIIVPSLRINYNDVGHWYATLYKHDAHWHFNWHWPR